MAVCGAGRRSGEAAKFAGQAREKEQQSRERDSDSLVRRLIYIP